MRMTSSKVYKEKFDSVVTYLHAAIGVDRKTVSQALDDLLKVYDYNWEHIEADDFRVLTDAIFDEPDPKEGKKWQADNFRVLNDAILDKPDPKEGKKWQAKGRKDRCGHLDSDHGNKKLKVEHQSQDLPIFEAPLAVMRPLVQDSTHQRAYKDAHTISGVQHAVKGVSVSHERGMTDPHESQAITNKKDSSTNFEVALSHSGAGKLSFTYNSASPDFSMPDMESVCKEMEARCLSTYNFLEPNFSFMKLLQDICQCIVDMGCESSRPREKRMIQIIPAVDFLSKPSVPRVLQSNQAAISIMSPNSRIIHGGICSSSAIAGEQNSSSNMQVIAKRPAHDVNDISKGEEHVSIPIINGSGNGILPPPFHYIPFNITFQKAHVNISLARIGDDSCCSDCFGDCLAEPLPCACATETGGNFAYTRDGLLTEAFLDTCVSMLREPDKHHIVYCKICPNELVKLKVNADPQNTKVSPDPCKGHQLTKFVKECWSKCGCSRNCGNRVVQRGITRPLQVYLTNGKKGWGLRASEELPRGAFVCEYVGEILTNNELDERNSQTTANERHTYPVNLDADWATEGVLEDDHSLSLDATFYGNVARFINHRCFDANLIGIPVEIETPDHHYYHLAFFTTRQTEPFEELTWDYGIDFDDVSHPIKAFKCLCRSEYCRGKRSISRSKSRALVLL
ncbi:histone-lysine N-methyltransferase SUVR4-like [Lolium rigidum]|uniref:histone-lysine N-methyltransferase SUVR4-like n=1 Tax=Lolium rigidum TaxID=89674 RepID=UPI001F5C2AF1|nr:histone-lysine N-methyltransferase SUVR4-like [Lolium rigidum]